MSYVPNAVSYTPGAPRAFVAFEDRGRDLSGLMDFANVVQIFPNSMAWQLTGETAPQFAEAVRAFFRAHEFTDRDSVVAVGDPVAIAILTSAAADENAGRVAVLKWDRLPCTVCAKFRKSCTAAGCPREVRGRYINIPVRLPWARKERA
jgi:hypothetical protein